MDDKPSLFNARVKAGIAFVVGLVIAIVCGILFIPKTVHADITEAQPAKVVLPAPQGSPPNPPKQPKVSVSQRTLSIPQADLVSRTTVTITGPDGEIVDHLETVEAINQILDLQLNLGCLVVLGEAHGIVQKAFEYTIYKSECTIVKVTTTIDSEDDAVTE